MKSIEWTFPILALAILGTLWIVIDHAEKRNAPVVIEAQEQPHEANPDNGEEEVR